MTKQTERNGEQVMEQKPEVPVSQNSPKQVVFRSKDSALVLAFKAGYMDKSHGQSNYVPSEIESFEEYFLRIDEIPANKERIERLRTHGSHGISFREVPDFNDREDLPPIDELEVMSIKELKDLCGKRKVEVSEDASKEAIMLTLIKKQ